MKIQIIGLLFVVGAGLLDEAYSSLRIGGVINGVAGFGLAMMSAIPGEAVAMGGLRSGMRAFGSFGGGGVETPRLISSISRVSSNAANKPFISEKATKAGWNPPYLSDIDIRQISLSKETRFARVFTGDDPSGQFLVRHKEIAHIINDPGAICIHLGLKNTPTHIADTYVPINTNMYIGRIGSQPNFGLHGNSGFQYQLLSRIPADSFQKYPFNFTTK